MYKSILENKKSLSFTGEGQIIPKTGIQNKSDILYFRSSLILGFEF